MQNSLSIFEFINKNNYSFNKGEWFEHIWLPLYDQKEVLLTDQLITFIRFGNSEGIAIPSELSIKDMKRDIIKSIKNNNIIYKEIKYDNPIVSYYPYIQNQIKTIRPNNLERKTWIILKVDDFKEFIMSLNTKVAKDIRMYYITLEKILLDYTKYVCEFNKNNEIKEIISNLEIEYKERIEEEIDNIRLDLINNYEFQKREPTDVIYIMGGESNKEKNVYKVGKTTIKNKNSRLVPYNTGFLESKEFLFEIECYDGHLVETILSNVFNHFKYIRSGKIINEMYIIEINELINIIKMIVDYQNKLFEYANNSSFKINELNVRNLNSREDLINEEVISSVRKNIQEIEKNIKVKLKASKPVLVEQKKESIIKNNISNWLFNVVEKSNNNDDFIELKEIREKYKQTFPYEKNLKNKDIERMINNLFNNKGIYLKEQHKIRIDSIQKLYKNVYLSYILR